MCGDWGRLSIGLRNGEEMEGKTYSKRNYIDVSDGEDSFLAFDIIRLDPENHYPRQEEASKVKWSRVRTGSSGLAELSCECEVQGDLSIFVSI